jgi:hypothetical protein
MDMYHDDFGFDALALESPLDRASRAGTTGTLEQDFAGNLVGLALASDLFTARKLGPRPWREGVLLATSWPGVSVRFSGERLDQDDLDAFLGCALLAFRNPGRHLGSTRFTLRELTRLIRPKGRRFAAHCLERSLWRLAAARVEIEGEDGQVQIQARLIHALLRDSAAGVCSMELNPRIMDGFRSATSLERLIATRAPLGTGPFRRWLVGFLANTSACLRLDLPGLRRQSGLSHQPMAAFRVRAIAAMQDLLDLGYIASLEPNGPDRLVVTHQIARQELSACLLLS